MRRLFGAVCIVACMLGSSLGLAACGSSNKTRPPPPPLDWRGLKHVDVDAEFNLFTPPEILISPGTTVTWHNRDTVAHNIKSSAVLGFGGNFGVDTAAFGPGASYSFTFKNLGTNYFYVCTIHTGMTGRVQVIVGTPATTVP